MLKALEKLIATRIWYIAEKYNVLHQWRIRGKGNRSAVDAVIYLKSRVDQAKCNGIVLSTLCMDIKWAFDNVHHRHLLRTLTEMGFPKKSITRIDTSLTDRKPGLRFNRKEEKMSLVLTGILRGSPISPIILLVYIKPLFDELEKKYHQAKSPSYVNEVGL